MAFAPAWSEPDNVTSLNTILHDILETSEKSRRRRIPGESGYHCLDDTVNASWEEHFLRKPPEAVAQTSSSSLVRRHSRRISVKDLDKEIRRSQTPTSRFSWSGYDPPSRQSYASGSAILRSSTKDNTKSTKTPPKWYHGIVSFITRRNNTAGTPTVDEDRHGGFHSHESRGGKEPGTSHSDSVELSNTGTGGTPISTKSRAAVDSQPDHDEHPSSWTLALITIGLCLSVFLISLDRNIITTAIPRIVTDFGSYNAIGWYGSAYLMTACAFQPLYGRIYMSFTTKPSFLVALAIFEVGSLLCALAPGSISLIVGRSIQGLGSAGVLTGSFLVITQSVSLEKRPVFFAAIGILYGCGATVGPLLGGVFTDTATWRWCFWFNLPVGAVTFLSVVLFFQPVRRRREARPHYLQRMVELDIIGNILILSGCVMLFIALEAPNQGYSWGSARVIGLFVGSGCSTLSLAAWQWYRSDRALLPPRIVSQRTVACSCVVAFLVYGVMGAHAYFLPIWFQAVKGTSAIQSGVDMIPYMLGNAIFSLLAGIFVSKNGYFTPPAIIGCAIGTVGCGLLSMLHVSTPSSQWIGYQVVVSAGLGMAVQQGFVAVQAVLPLADVPIGTAAVVASQSLGGAVFISVSNTIFEKTLLDGISKRPELDGIDTTGLTATGITTFRSLVNEKQLHILLKIYNSSLWKVFLACIPLAGLAVFFTLGLEWRSVSAHRRAEGPEKAEETA